ncbi:MAG TPA: hypothetical protein DEQ47_14630 [Solibacterales bacterium]|nr:hypothetical protein [Bryobacterales bacterium]
MAISGWRGALAASLMLAGLTACGGNKGVKTDEEAPRMATVLVMSDPRAAQQLLNGFYALEQNQWRWTAAKFSVALRPPAGVDKGATLRVKLTVPAIIIEKLKSTTLTARIGATALAPATYSQPGEYVYAREVPAAALTGQSVRVDFTLDHAIPPGSVDQRELGVVVSMVGLEAR